MNQKFCTNCGSPIPQGSRVCPHCGTPILSEDNSEAYPSQPTPSYHQPNNIAQPNYPTPQNNKNTLLLTVLIVLVSLLVVGLGVGVFLYMNNKSTEEKLQQQSQIEQLKVSQDSLKNVNKVLQTSVNKKPKKHPTPYPQGTFNLSGKIGKYPIRMTLKINGNDIKGAYYYVKSGNGSTLDLYGEAHGQNLSIYEIEQTEGCTGAFDGTFDGINFDGTFINGKGQQFKMSLEAE